MQCPTCSSFRATVLYEDEAVCGCGNTITIRYCVCSACGFFWRLQGDKVTDGGEVNQDMLNEALNYMVQLLSSEVCRGEEVESLRQALHSCIKCRSLAIETDKNNFVCTSCGFEWEVSAYGD